MSQLTLLQLPRLIGTELNYLLLFWAIARAARTGELGKRAVAVLMSIMLTGVQLVWAIVILVPRISP